MKLVSSLGGQSIGVYDPTLQNKNRVYELIKDHRISYYAAADYSKGEELEMLTQKIIDYTAASFELRMQHLIHKDESEML